MKYEGRTTRESVAVAPTHVMRRLTNPMSCAHDLRQHNHHSNPGFTRFCIILCEIVDAFHAPFRVARGRHGRLLLHLHFPPMPASDNGVSETSLPERTTMPSSPPVITVRSTSSEKDEEAESRPISPMSESEEPHPEQSIRIPEPTSAQRSNSNVDASLVPNTHNDNQEGHNNDQQEGQEEDVETPDPSIRIEDFDWDELHERYHDAMKRCHTDEDELRQEWESLMNVVLHPHSSV